MPTKTITSFVFIIAVAAVLLRADTVFAKNYNLTISGDLLNRFGGTCGDALGDNYDIFCPSGACSCFQYDEPEHGKFMGNITGSKAKNGFVHVHFTFDAGDHTGVNGTGLGCAPVFGEIQLQGTKDSETIYFAGSFCDPLGNPNSPNASQKMAGGWSINSSTHSVKAFGTFTGNFKFNKIGFGMSLHGRTQ